MSQNNTPEDDDKTLHDAVSAAVDEVTYTETREDGTDEPGTDDNAPGADGGAAGGDEPPVLPDGDGGPAGEGDEEDAPGGTPEDEETASDDGEGEGAGGDDGGEAGADPAGDAEGTGDDNRSEKDQGSVDEDPVTAPIPASLSKRTQTRIQSLIDKVKENDSAVSERDEIMGAIEASGATPEQYAGALSVLKMYNSDSPDDKRKALEIVRGMERELAIELGEGQNHVKLADYPDLQAEVDAGTLSEDRAIEIAALRAKDTHVAAKRQQRSEQQDQQTQTQRLVEQGKKDLNTLGQQLTADPAYKALYPTFTGILNRTLRNVHPTEWASTAQDIFDQLKAANPNAGATPAPARPSGSQQPLRPKNGSGGSGKRPANAESAVSAMDAALENM